MSTNIADEGDLLSARGDSPSRGADPEEALRHLGSTLASLPLPTGVAEHLETTIACAVAHTRRRVASEDQISSAALLQAAQGARMIQGFADAVGIQAARSLADRAGRELLARRGASSPEELSLTARQRWRAKTKSVVAHELSVLTGYGIGACHLRVAFALAPCEAVATTEASLARGDVDWRAVSESWQRCRSMDVEQARSVAEAVFAIPAELDRRESWAEFQRRLAREVARVEGRDPQKAKERRVAALATREVYGELCDDGLGRYVISAGGTSVAAASERIETIARRARKAGDERSLAHLRSDTAMALLVHGVLPLPERPTELLAPETHDVCRIISGLPVATVEVVVPVGAWSGGAAGGSAADVGPPDSLAAEIPGHGFLTPEHVRELAADPGSTLHRLLTDPADGRLVERSIAAYRPDADMIAQVRATDRSCRAPGCVVPAHRCELDHERPYGAAGGSTCEPNLNAKHRPHHQLKTEQFWSSVMDSTRHVTWTTLFGKIYRTRPHDYRQYCDPGGRQPSHSIAARNPLTIEDADLRNQLVYAALSARTAGDDWLEARDDGEDCTDGMGTTHPLTVFHRSGGRRRPGPPPGQPTPEEVLAHPTCQQESAADDPGEEPPPF